MPPSEPTSAATVPALANSNCARLPYPYDEATPADRAALAAFEKAAWFIFCLGRDDYAEQ